MGLVLGTNKQDVGHQHSVHTVEGSQMWLLPVSIQSEPQLPVPLWGNSPRPAGSFGSGSHQITALARDPSAYKIL